MNPLNFDLEKFVGDGVRAKADFFGKEFNLLPFSSGWRMCMGMSLGVLFVETTIANLLHCFWWSTPTDLDMMEGPYLGSSTKRLCPCMPLPPLDCHPLCTTSTNQTWPIHYIDTKTIFFRDSVLTKNEKDNVSTIARTISGYKFVDFDKTSMVIYSNVDLI